MYDLIIIKKLNKKNQKTRVNCPLSEADEFPVSIFFAEGAVVIFGRVGYVFFEP